MDADAVTLLLPDPPLAPPTIALALPALAECVCESLATHGAGPTCWCGLYPGAIVSWDYCGCERDACGMGWVRLQSVFPYDTFPIGVLDSRCTKPLAWAVEVGALRCVPQPVDGSPPDNTVMNTVAIEQVLDARALWLAIKCCGLEVAAEIYQPVGPEGACVGGFWTAYLALD